ncbi:putative Diguanylate cyclase [Planktothrix serta PCC 8927]|uniref:Diguanylate cyclase n=1 Tax=Planktothrix serta PCC 8927 TaxID=671068 RepID=A0A7Z9BYY7_9CYAN|nr:EAL domain-containing protein [Planktothrix serta]VXD22556.1 putative Diguanylate cyclase [Planktothrix serta PCC 8927]
MQQEDALILNHDLMKIEQEFIHNPGRIQPHGLLLVLQEPDLKILQVSQNALKLFGVSFSTFLNRPLSHFLNKLQFFQIQDCLINNNFQSYNPIHLVFHIKNKKIICEGILHRNQDIVVLELELTQDQNVTFVNFYHLVRVSVCKIQSATNFQSLTQFLAEEIRKISGFDRVMVYQFDQANNGIVIAEDKRQDLESLLGLHYPHTDIPRFYRELYKQNWLRLLVDIDHEPVDIIPAINPVTQKPLDLSFSVLRSVSPCHLEYLRNMGVQATLCISLIKKDRLWGLIACHHYSPRYLSYGIRKACEFLGQVMAVELPYKEVSEDYLYYHEILKLVRKNLLNAPALETSFIQSLVQDKTNLLNLVKAQGAVIRFGEDLMLIGQTPSLTEVQQLITWLSQYCHQEVFYTDCLPALYPKAASYKDLISGILAISLSPNQSEYHLIWFRPEVIQMVNWAGNPQHSLEIENPGVLRLTPRQSFELWKETVKLKSLPWKSVEIETAQELRNSLMLAALESSEYQLRQSKELAQVTLQSIGDAVITTNNQGEIESLNPVAEELTGWSVIQAKNLPLHDVFKIFDGITHEFIENPVKTVLKEGCIFDFSDNVILRSKDGKERAIDNSAAPIRNRDGAIIGAVLVFRDVTQERELSQRLSWQACHDALTGLINRSEFEKRVKTTLQLMQESPNHHAICYLDLDQFKIVNDTCGHLAGDELLRQLSCLLQTQVSERDTLARLGGDEFGLLLNYYSFDEAQKKALDLCNLIRSFRFIWQEKVFSIGVSIGLVIIDEKTSDLATILSAADAACYAAKNQGRNRVHLYQADDQDLIQQRREIRWAAQIPQALEEDRFCLYHQPIVEVNTTSKQHKHGEILLRLRDTSGQLVSPMAFIPAAERYDLMKSIDRWVIRTVFSHLEKHHQSLNLTTNAGETEEFYAINLSGASLNDNEFIKFLYEQFKVYQVSPKMICFEITETLAIANLKKAVQLIQSLKLLGCSFALDDFGSGMSSFSYLKTLPIDYLKIDGGFVREILTDPVAREIVEAIHRIGHVMKIKTIAEFVENDAILTELKKIGIDYAQGYGIGKPQPFILPVIKTGRETDWNRH